MTELTPGEMAQRSGVAVSALHFYEREGLIHSRRTSGNQRRYARETLRRVAFDVEGHFVVDARERPEMRRQDHPDHGSVWTSTETTGGRFCAIAVQLSPASGDA